MKNRAALLTASVLLLAVSAFAQRPEDRRPKKTPIMTAGICCTTFTRAGTFT